jgi:hypothetical protein
MKELGLTVRPGELSTIMQLCAGSNEWERAARAAHAARAGAGAEGAADAAGWLVAQIPIPVFFVGGGGGKGAEGGGGEEGRKGGEEEGGEEKKRPGRKQQVSIGASGASGLGGGGLGRNGLHLAVVLVLPRTVAKLKHPKPNQNPKPQSSRRAGSSPSAPPLSCCQQYTPSGATCSSKTYRPTRPSTRTSPARPRYRATLTQRSAGPGRWPSANSRAAGSRPGAGRCWSG